MPDMEMYGVWLAVASFFGMIGTMVALVITTRNAARTTTVDMLSEQVDTLRVQLEECREHETKNDAALAIAKEEIERLMRRVLKLEDK